MTFSGQSGTEVLDGAVPESLRDPDGYWFGLGVRAEVIVYDTRKVDADSLGGYTDLGEAGWLGRLCLQRSISGRMRSIVAALIAERGERDAELVARGWRANLATSVFDEQAELLLAVESGQCEVGIAGSDQVARILEDGLGPNIGVHFPSAGTEARYGISPRPVSRGTQTMPHAPLSLSNGWLRLRVNMLYTRMAVTIRSSPVFRRRHRSPAGPGMTSALSVHRAPAISIGTPSHFWSGRVFAKRRDTAPGS